MTQIATAPPPPSLATDEPGERPAGWSRIFPALLGFGTVGLVAANDGGYWPTSWGWTALALCWLAALSLVLVVDLRLCRLDLAVLAAFGAVLGLTALSTLWSDSVPRSVLEAERTAVYVAALGAALLLVRPRDYRVLLSGLWGGIVLVTIYSLATRLFPDRLGSFDSIAGYRLSEPIGYWNGLGILAAMGALLALGLAARARSLFLRAAAGASLLVLVPALYFTFSRGAWIALFVGLVAALCLDPRRVQLLSATLLLTAWPALGIWTASGSEGLTRLQAAPDVAARDGHRVAATLALLALGAAVTALVLGVVERRLRFPRTVRLAYTALLVVVIGSVLVAVFARYGSPPTLVQRAYDDFTADPRQLETNLNRRLFDLSNNGRLRQWDVAVDEFRENPVLGSGAGTYEQYWVRDRNVAGKVRDAHSLYLETLGEMGLGGLALLLIALVLPGLAAVKSRRRALVPAAAGAYVAYLAHAGVDWDWELTGITLSALFCAAALLLANRTSSRSWQIGGRLRIGLLTAALAVAGFSTVGLVGNSALVEMGRAFAARDLVEAEAQAQKARRWAPWSGDPWHWLGFIHVVQGERAQARTSYLEAIEREPRSWELWFNLASVSPARARAQALAKVAELNPLSGVQTSESQQQQTSRAPP